MNLVILHGHLGADPEVRTAPSGKMIANFRLATNEGGDRPPEWHSIVAFDRQAELAQRYLHRGDGVNIQGRITTRKWQDKEGRDRYSTEIIANYIEFTGKKAADPKPADSTTPPSSPDASRLPDDDIPF